MFSAIVAVVLIMTVSVLVGTLVMSEEKTSTQIYGMLNNYQLADAANIARADALQSFNYAFREKIEDYLTYNNTELVNDAGMPLFQIKKGDGDITFDELKRKFEESILLNTNNGSKDGDKFSAVLNYVSENTITNFQPWTYGKYRVELNDTSSTARVALFDALAKVLNRQASEGLSFLDVVECNETSCPKGSFYFNIPLNKLTDEEYELIPRIIVKDTFTQEQIKMAILPKTNLKVYIPLRFFKVLYEARDAYNGIKNAHAQNAEYKLGFCDEGYCVPRTNPLTRPSTDTWNLGCPTSEEAKWIVQLDTPKAGITNYFSGGSSVGSKGLWGYGAEEVCNESISSNAFKVDSLDSSFKVYNEYLVPEQRGAVINGCGYYHLAIIATPEVKADILNGAGQKLKCGRITDVVVDIVFVDMNPNFLVKGTTRIAGVNSNFYKIRIRDLSFDEAINANNATTNYSCSSGLDGGVDQCKPVS